MTSISQERAGLAAVGWWLRTREQARFQRSYTDARAVTEPATRVFVHITITNPANYASDDAHARAVESIGISRFPSTGISYNRLFMQSGTAYEGQPIGRRGAHTVNDFKRASCSTSGCPGRGAPLTAPDWNLNYNARAYVICQNVGDVVTDKQLDSLAKAIAADKLAGFVVRTAEIHGHRCVSSKSCPGDRMWARMSALEALVDGYLRTGLKPPPPPPLPQEDDDMPFITPFGSSQFRLVSDRVYPISEGTYRMFRDGGVPIKVLANDAIRGLEIILNGAEADNDAAIAALDAKLGELVDAHVPEPPTP
jgi:hypothetical protein